MVERSRSSSSRHHHVLLEMWVCQKCFEQNQSGEECCSSCGAPNIQTQASDRKLCDWKLKDEDYPCCSGCNKKKLSPEDPCFTCKTTTLKIARVKPVPRITEAPKEIRMVLLGKTGAGKSATANTVLGEKIFTSECSFISVTTKCQFALKERFEKEIMIIDTPGFFDTSTSKEIIEEEIKKCVAISCPGPHAFLLVTPMSNRFTKEDGDVFDQMSAMFGKTMMKYLIVVFTGRDQLDGSSVHDHVGRCPEKLGQIIEAAGGGYVTFNNRGSENEKDKDVRDLLDRIQEVVRRNGGDYFTSEMYEEAEEIMQERILRKIEERKEQLRMDVETELMAEMEEIMKRERENFQKVHKDDLQQVETVKKGLVSKKNTVKKTKSERECEKLLENLAKMEAENLEKKRQLLEKAEALEGDERIRMQKRLGDLGLELTQIVAERKDAEEGVTAERFCSAVEQKAQVFRKEERKMLEEQDTDTPGRFTEGMKKLKTSFLKLFK